NYHSGNKGSGPAIVSYTRRLVLQRVPDAAQHAVVRCRPGTATVRGGHSLRRSPISDAPLRCARAASHPGHAVASGAFGDFFTFPTTHLLPPAPLRPRFAPLLRSPNEGGRSADPANPRPAASRYHVDPNEEFLKC